MISTYDYYFFYFWKRLSGALCHLQRASGAILIMLRPDGRLAAQFIFRLQLQDLWGFLNSSFHRGLRVIHGFHSGTKRFSRCWKRRWAAEERRRSGLPPPPPLPPLMGVLLRAYTAVELPAARRRGRRQSPPEMAAGWSGAGTAASIPSPATRCPLTYCQLIPISLMWSRKSPRSSRMAGCWPVTGAGTRDGWNCPPAVVQQPLTWAHPHPPPLWREWRGTGLGLTFLTAALLAGSEPLTFRTPEATLVGPSCMSFSSDWRTAMLHSQNFFLFKVNFSISSGNFYKFRPQFIGRSILWLRYTLSGLMVNYLPVTTSD